MLFRSCMFYYFAQTECNAALQLIPFQFTARSEERRVGLECLPLCISPWFPYLYNKKCSSPILFSYPPILPVYLLPLSFLSLFHLSLSFSLLSPLSISLFLSLPLSSFSLSLYPLAVSLSLTLSLSPSLSLSLSLSLSPPLPPPPPSLSPSPSLPPPTSPYNTRSLFFPIHTPLRSLFSRSLHLF